ncbi:hypothetical protein BURPS1106B_1300 [Burkholderia pseudomallei 1106b]|uniref:Uncharacterized protein n=2 Tax=Burkholderia pseudomallei TaxID=28450 RepID=A0A0E1W0K7_BURPE|nr:hypothetical protein BURPS1106A_A0698 [Burkholderia pseudomallei 1106a]EEH27459.1 conserved hypothetical protein [Burkholderia pseudomallei Pakistan 9]EES23195.1 hypothetical protein BURPS1106B_1300 [Burkholderia pseudomallei 1106b]EET03182.1 hypothetical protein BURPS1710A_A3201 [Burkholderia pseudomallei 1710a]
MIEENCGQAKKSCPEGSPKIKISTSLDTRSASETILLFQIH